MDNLKVNGTGEGLTWKQSWKRLCVRRLPAKDQMACAHKERETMKSCGTCKFSEPLMPMPLSKCRYLHKGPLPFWIDRDMNREILMAPLLAMHNDGTECQVYEAKP